MKPILNIVLLWSSILCFGQNISNKEVSAEFSKGNNKMAKQAIHANFNVAAIAVYQDNAEEKIKDLYSYFQMLSGNESEQFKNQVIENVKMLFGNTPVTIDNIVLESEPKTTLDAFLQQLKVSKHTLQFLEVQQKTVQENNFLFTYTVLIDSQKKRVQQQVFFYPIQKQFGNKTKEVWEYKLGPLKM